MTRMPIQATRFDRLQRQGAQVLSAPFQGSWRRRSVGVLALLFGFYAGQNVTSWWLQTIGQRPVVVLSVVLMLELVVRIRTRVVQGRPPLGWLVLDNLRVGVVYAIVLEAFKLGS